LSFVFLKTNSTASISPEHYKELGAQRDRQSEAIHGTNWIIQHGLCFNESPKTKETDVSSKSVYGNYQHFSDWYLVKYLKTRSLKTKVAK
jgi:hypothetical protein